MKSCLWSQRLDILTKAYRLGYIGLYRIHRIYRIYRIYRIIYRIHRIIYRIYPDISHDLSHGP